MIFHSEHKDFVFDGFFHLSEEDVRAFAKQEAKWRESLQRERERLMSERRQAHDRDCATERSDSYADEAGSLDTAECGDLVESEQAGEKSDGDGDDDGDPDPEPERQIRHQNPLSSSLAGQSSRRSSAELPSALINFPALPDDAFVRLPVVTGLFACSPATVWRRVKAGAIPAPLKLSARMSAWRVGDLRAALAGLSK